MEATLKTGLRNPNVLEWGKWKKFGFISAFIALAVICLLPEQPGLSVAGQCMIGIMIFAVILWSTSAVSYPVSAGLIMTLTALFIGFSPGTNPDQIIGTTAGMKMALVGFSSPAFCLVGAALFLAAAMTITGLDKRIALFVLHKVGAEPKRIVLGVILCGLILSFFVPSTTARVACLVPIVIGVIQALNLPMKSAFAAALMITVAQVDSVWNIGIKTAAAQNMVAVKFIREITGTDITWMNWFIAAAPFAALLSVCLFFLVCKCFNVESTKLESSSEIIGERLRELGPMSRNEWKLLIVSIILLSFWVSEKTLHQIDTTTTTVCAIAILMCPGIGVMNWQQTVNKINWGTLLLFGVGISLGSALLSTKAAQWLADMIVLSFGLENSTTFMILAVMAIFLIVIHLGFASATGLAAAIIPIIIAVLGALKTPGVNIIGLTMILQFVISFGYILPVNAPQNMIAYSTGTFEVSQFAKFGLMFTLVAYGLLLVLAQTYWKWLGLV